MRPLVVQLMGGLGNQLFQWCFGLELRNRTQRDVKFSFLDIHSLSAASSRRRFALESVVEQSELHTGPVPSSLILQQVSRLIPSLWLREESFDDDALARVTKRTLFASGYFQRFDYVDSVWDQVAGRLGRKFSGWTKMSAPTASFLVVHMRFGDYKNSARTRQFHGLTKYQYFNDSIKIMYEKTGETNVLIVTDDQTSALSYVREFDLPSVINLEISCGSDEWEDLATIASAKGVICSNSTFSWWGAYIASKIRSTEIIVPEPWFSNPEISTQFLLPRKWLKVRRDFFV